MRKSFISNDEPVYYHPLENLVPVSDYLSNLMAIPPSKMFLIKKSLAKYKESCPGQDVFDASQGDGGASLPGVSKEILMRAAEIHAVHGTAYDMPFGAEVYRKAVIEQYWKFDSKYGWGPNNVVATVGGRDALVKAYQAMLANGYGRVGDLIIVSRVPWISYNWGPYGIGANVLLAPGTPETGWAYTEDGIRECVAYAARSGRKIAGLLITNPDNPTGRTISIEKQVELARSALEAGVAYVLFDWIYHFVTDEAPMDLNNLFEMFSPKERERIMILDGITKSMGGSNIRNAHLIAADNITKYIVSRASHEVIPSFYSQAVAMAAYEIGFENASKTIVEPTNASRKVLDEFLGQKNMNYILGKGYYAFINISAWLSNTDGWDSIPFGEYAAENYGVALVPGAFSSDFGRDWVRFSYATPPERTLLAANRLYQSLESLA